jgi:hypothetical protein
MNEKLRHFASALLPVGSTLIFGVIAVAVYMSVGIVHPTEKPRLENLSWSKPAALTPGQLAEEAVSRIRWGLSWIMLASINLLALIVVPALTAKAYPTTALFKWRLSPNRLFWILFTACLTVGVLLEAFNLFFGPAVSTGLLKRLGSSTRIRFDIFLRISNILTFTNACLIVAGAALVSFVPDTKTASSDELAERLTRLRRLLILASALITIGTFEVSSLFRMVTVWISKDEVSQLENLANHLSVGTGLLGTGLLVAAFLPAFHRLSNAAERLAAQTGKTFAERKKLLEEWGLTFSLSEQLAQVAAYLAPFFVGGTMAELTTKLFGGQ